MHFRPYVQVGVCAGQTAFSELTASLSMGHPMSDRPPAADVYDMREPCSSCGTLGGRREDRNGQACIFCVGCGRHCYNAPKVETGDEQRSVRTRPDLKPSQRYRILERDGYRCVICFKAGDEETNLHIGHLLSVDDGRRIGVPEDELHSDENLAVVCEECNLGAGRSTFSIRLVARILYIRHELAQRPASGN